MSNTLNMRNKYIWELRQNGATLESIGNDFNLTRERIRQICEKEKDRMARAIREENEKV